MKARLSAFFHSVRFRLALWFSLVLALVLIAFGTIIYLREAQAVRYDAAQRLALRLRQFEEGVLRPARYEHQENQTTQITVAFPLREDEVALVFDRKGQVLQNSGGMSAEEAERLARTGLKKLPGMRTLPGPNLDRFFYEKVRLSGTGEAVEYLAGVFPLPGEENGDAFLLALPVDPEGRAMRLLMTLLLSGLATLLAAAGGGFWLASRALRPVQQITRAAQEISENDLDRRLNLSTRDELGDLARTFDRMLDRLKAAFDRQRRFTADASHELRTPLAILTLETERVLEGKRSAEEYRAALQTVRSETGIMTRLVEEMLALARMDSGQARLKQELLDLSDIAVDAVERLMPLAGRKGIRLETGELPELPVRGDRAALGQAAGNLIENALKYTPAGDGRWVRVESSEQDEQGIRSACLRVSDNGPGIPPEALPHLFERFFRADEARTKNPDEEGEIPGSGLGLSIVQRIAELHGGKVTARNLPEGGACFEISLPLR